MPISRIGAAKLVQAERKNKKNEDFLSNCFSERLQSVSSEADARFTAYDFNRLDVFG